MSVPYELSPQKKNDYLSTAIEKRIPLVLSIKTEDGWRTYKSQFLRAGQDDRYLVLKYPTATDHPVPEIVPGQNVGVSFRRGHKKCMFNTITHERCHCAIDDKLVVPAFKLIAPTKMFELQRRMFYRTPVPQDHAIDVEVWRQSDSSIAARKAGHAVDLSAGGVSLEIDAADSPRWKTNTPLRCIIRPTWAPERAVEATAQFRHIETSDPSRVRHRQQYAGLEATETGRNTLQNILDLTMDLQRL